MSFAVAVLMCTYVSLTLNLLTWKVWWAPNNASRWQMGFNSSFKGLSILDNVSTVHQICIEQKPIYFRTLLILALYRHLQWDGTKLEQVRTITNQLYLPQIIFPDTNYLIIVSVWIFVFISSLCGKTTSLYPIFY
jgi:hypothetical protein